MMPRVKNLLVIFSMSFMSLGPTKAWSVTATYSISQSDSSIRVVPSTFAPPPPDGYSDVVVAGTRFLTNSFNYGIEEQSAGSLESMIGGSLNADVTGSTLTFQQSALNVQPKSGPPFLPAISDSPGQQDDFGAFSVVSFSGTAYQNGEFALLDTALQLVNGSAAIGSVPSGLRFATDAGVLDYRLDFPPRMGWVYLTSDTQNVVNQTTSSVTGDVNGTIHIPFHVEFPYALNDVGDYSQNLQVDAADYVLWRKLNGTSVAKAGDPPDGSFNKSVGDEDYAIWRSHFGNTDSLLVYEGVIVATRVGGGSALGSVPEPVGLLLISLAVVTSAFRRSPTRRRAYLARC